jgi:hypothetical protein
VSVALEGQALLQHSSNAGTSFGLTIPGPTDAIVALLTGYTSDNALAAQLNFTGAAGISLDRIAFAIYGGFETQVDTYIITPDSADWPGTGSQTLFFQDVIDEGINIFMGYYSGVDPLNPIIASQSFTGGTGTTFTSSLGGVGGDDMGVMCAYTFSASPDVTEPGQTTLVQTNFNAAGIGVAEALGSGALTASAADLVAVAFALRAAAAAQQVNTFFGRT